MNKRLNIFIILFLLSFQIMGGIPSPPLKTIMLEPQDEAKIFKNSKLELSFETPKELQIKFQNFFNGDIPTKKTSVNPFLEWELNIVTVFKNRNSGNKITKYGFFYQDFERNEAIDSWVKKRTKYNLRTRFAPPEPGQWTAMTTIFVHGKKMYETTLFEFEVNEGESKGYTTIAENKRYLKRNDEVIVPTGVNLPSPYVGNNMTWSWKNNEKLNLEAWTLFQKDVERYALQGGEYFRFFLMPSSSDIEFEKLGNYYDRMNFAWEIDELLNLCERENVLINFNMLYHTPIMRSADYHQFRWDYHKAWADPEAWPYKDVNPVYAYSDEINSTMPSDMFLNEQTMRYAKQRTRYIISRWGYSTAIGMFELMSEPWHINEDWINKHSPYDENTTLGDSSRRAAYEYHKQISNYIKNDLGHKKHLLGAVGRLNRSNVENAVFSHVKDTSFTFNDSTWFLDNIDFISISYYSSFPSKMIVSKKNKDNIACEEGENSVFCAVNNLFENYDKPILFGEADHGDGTHGCSDLEGHKIDAMRYNFNGIAGHYLWGVFSYPHKSSSIKFDERNSWKSAVMAKNQFNDRFFTSIAEDFGIQGRQKSNIRSIKTDIKEHQYILNESLEKGVGYLYNRTFNVHTAKDGGETTEKESACYLEKEDYQTPVPISFRPKLMKIEGLKRRTDYVIRFYGYKNGSFLGQTVEKSSFWGNLSLKHPILGGDKNSNPIIWYQIEMVED